MAEAPLCFVLMPFGIKKDPAGGPDIDFNAVYELGIRRALEDVGIQPIRADEELTGGIIHKPLFERLMLCDYVIADLTTANPNVFYGLGVRHAMRRSTTVMIFARHQPIPFDVALLRAMPYDLTSENRFTSVEADQLRKMLGERLRSLRSGDVADSPVFQLITDYEPPQIAHLKTDVFREQAHYSESFKKRLASARSSRDVALAREIEDSLGPLHDADPGILVDLFLTYRGLKQFDRMLGLFDRLPPELKRNVTMREQLAFALNRLGRREEAVQALENIVEERGPNPETCGLIGRVYKDLWQEAAKEGRRNEAAGFLRNAIAAYEQGFDADWRDAYPGINAVTLLEIQGDPESLARKEEILPVVRYAVNQRLRASKPDYWDHATLLELAVLDDDEKAASWHLSDARGSIREPWEPETTANNLEMIRAAREKRGAGAPWLGSIIDTLRRSAR